MRTCHATSAAMGLIATAAWRVCAGEHADTVDAPVASEPVEDGVSEDDDDDMSGMPDENDDDEDDGYADDDRVASDADEESGQGAVLQVCS